MTEALRLFHGSSSHYAAEFIVGGPLTVRALDRREALRIAIADAVREAGLPPSPYPYNRILEQKSGEASWTHEGICLTPNRDTAMAYARSNARYGGELITALCSVLAELDPAVQRSLLDAFADIPALAGGGAPILIEVTGVPIDCLEGERPGESARAVLEELLEFRKIGIPGLDQQVNFRLVQTGGVIEKVIFLDA